MTTLEEITKKDDVSGGQALLPGALLLLYLLWDIL